MNKFTLSLLSVFFIFISCKKDSSSSSGPVVSDACQLVSTAEASAITGESYSSTQTSEQPVVGLKICDYENADYGLFQISLTQTAAINGAGLKTAKEYYESMKANFTNREMVTGVGDEAFIENTNGMLYILYTNDYYINICIMQKGLPIDPNRWTTAQKKSKKIAAGKKAVENLQKLL